ncbi:MAG: hypothetical protein PHQ41_05395 [Candidatus Cloacimonetes bacterium]|nr:hypothetical protein [Candidatus Cloacimonadota bacterium]
MELQKDGVGNFYKEIENLRLTYISAQSRKPAQDWSGADVLRIQAYKNADNNSLFRGAELPIATPDVFVALIAALCEVYSYRHKNNEIDSSEPL